MHTYLVQRHVVVQLDMVRKPNPLLLVLCSPNQEEGVEFSNDITHNVPLTGLTQHRGGAAHGTS